MLGEFPMRKRDTLTAIVLVPRPAGLRPTRQRSPLKAAVTLAVAGVATALLFGIFNTLAPVGSLFAHELAAVTHSALRRGAPVGAPVVLPAVRVIASN
jgi:hypothetical protein